MSRSCCLFLHGPSPLPLGSVLIRLGTQPFVLPTKDRQTGMCWGWRCEFGMLRFRAPLADVHRSTPGQLRALHIKHAGGLVARFNVALLRVEDRDRTALWCRLVFSHALCSSSGVCIVTGTPAARQRRSMSSVPLLLPGIRNPCASAMSGLYMSIQPLRF